MANEDQHRVLQQGVKAWNKWREKNPNVDVDLSAADLSQTNLEKGKPKWSRPQPDES